VRKKKLRSATKTEIFQWLKFFPCYSLLWVPGISNQTVLFYATHIKKVIARYYLFVLRSKITENQYQVRNFAWHRRGS